MKFKLISTLSVAAFVCVSSAFGTPIGTSNTIPSYNTAALRVNGQILNINEAGISITVPEGMNFSKDGEIL